MDRLPLSLGLLFSPQPERSMADGIGVEMTSSTPSIAGECGGDDDTNDGHLFKGAKSTLKRWSYLYPSNLL